MKDAVAEYEAERGLDYADCGETTVTCPFDERASADGTVRDCLLAAFSECRAAEGRFVANTDEGDPVPMTVLVEAARSGGCQVVEFMDTRADEFGPQKLTRAECATLSTNGCTGVVADGCRTVEEY